MGTATAFGFQPTQRGAAVATGDFVLAPTEVNPVIRTLREHGISVTALHNHMLFDERAGEESSITVIGPCAERGKTGPASLCSAP